MASKIEQRRLRDVARALALPDSFSVQEIESQIAQLSDAIRAAQSLDDLGSVEANNKAYCDESILSQRRNALKEKLKNISSHS